MNTEILNKGVELALEFGPNWMQQIQARLVQTFQQLSLDELNRYDTICRAVMKEGHSFVYAKLQSASERRMKSSQHEVSNELTAFLLKDHPWLSQDNVQRILSQGFYYAWKDGYDGGVSN